jgi:hypothetical protein
MAAGALVNVRFRCEVMGCDCETTVEARVFVRESSRLYEYLTVGECGKCSHRLFSRHRPMGEQQSASDRPAVGVTLRHSKN